ncbi:DUF2188 domain-containing protein [Nocardioides endophyticus]|uniref:DUF2188 domain-containing protein n=1 Tax=Nocardioides endophyticus TaxID=1353775 RepID=UPI0031EF0D5B
MGEPIETSCVDGVWRNSVGRDSALPGEYRSRQSAVEVGRDEARVRGVVHVVREADGSVSERNRYPRRSEELPS